MIAYKLFSMRRDGTLGPLFINRTQRIETGKWLEAEAHQTKGFAFRPGWHCCFKPVAPHLAIAPRNALRRVWVKVEIEDYCTYARPESQGGEWVLANRMRVLEIME